MSELAMSIENSILQARVAELESKLAGTPLDIVDRHVAEERERIITVLLGYSDPDEFRDYIDNDLLRNPVLARREAPRCPQLVNVQDRSIMTPDFIDQVMDGPAGAGRTEQEIVDQTNALARDLAANHGWTVEEGFRFDQSKNPRSRMFWEDARTAQISLTSTDPEDTLRELEA